MPVIVSEAEIWYTKTDKAADKIRFTETEAYMKKLIEIGNRYAAQSDWRDFAFVKFCLCAMGVLIGMSVPKRNKKATQVIAGAVFGVTYLLLMKKVFRIIGEMGEYKEGKQ